MKSIMHSDYWAEIPAGEFLTGISAAQENLITERMYEQFKSNYFPYWKKRLLENAPWIKFDQQAIYLERFYIMRFQVSNAQVAAFYRGEIDNLPGSLEGTEEDSAHKISKVTDEFAEAFCKALGARLPSNWEWEKSARGPEGRLYPWGDEWDIDAGYFYRGQFATPQEARKMHGIDAFPNGVSPYGIYGMIGYLPQLTGTFPWPGARGGNASASSAERAWIDYMIPFIHQRGDYSSLRPVLDKWPRQQWQGYHGENV